MNKKIVWLVTVLLLTATTFVEAQQPNKVSRIGYLSGASLSAIPKRIEALRQGLRELGYVEGKNIVIEWRWGKENLIGCLTSRLSWCILRWTLLSPLDRQ